MIHPLRKIHRRVFLLLAILLPLLFIAGIRARHHTPAQKALPQKPASVLQQGGKELVFFVTAGGSVQ